MIKKYLSLIKFSHTIFAMPFAMIGFVLGLTSIANTDLIIKLILVVLCMIFARSAAMAFNRWLDKPAYGLGNRVPRAFITTVGGINFIIDELNRIAHGDLA